MDHIDDVLAIYNEAVIQSYRGHVKQYVQCSYWDKTMSTTTQGLEGFTM